MPEEDAASIGLASDQTLKLTKAGELALNKIPLQSINSSTKIVPTAKIITTSAGAMQHINQPVKIITLNSSSAKTANVTKIQSKPIVINAPYVIPQTNRSSVTKIQPESGQKKGPKIIRLTPDQFAAIKQGKVLKDTYAIFANSKLLKFRL